MLTCLNHPETIPPPPVCGKSIFYKTSLCCKNVGDHCSRGHKAGFDFDCIVPIVRLWLFQVMSGISWTLYSLVCTRHSLWIIRLVKSLSLKEQNQVVYQLKTVNLAVWEAFNKRPSPFLSVRNSVLEFHVVYLT